MPETLLKILPGDFWGVARSGVAAWANRNLTCTPQGSHTEMFHFGVIADPVFDPAGQFVDFETRESISKGPATLRFFERNLGQDVELYRLPDITRADGLRLARSISRIGDKPYGFRDFLEAAADVACLLFTLQRPPWTPSQFKVSQNSAYLCTEIPAYGARAIGRPIEPSGEPDLWAIPVLYLQAVEEGRLTRYYKGNLRDLYRQYTGKGDRIWQSKFTPSSAA